MNFTASRFSSTLLQKPTLYTETEAVEPTQEDIDEYARRIGINPETEPHLLHLARSGLMVKLPPDWKPCKDAHRDVWFYYNNKTHISQWDHPLDTVFKEKVTEARQDHAMNRMQSLDVNGPKPLKSLPPLKKGGGGLNPLTFPSSPLTRLGPLRNPSFSSSDDVSQFSGSGSFQQLKPKPQPLLQPLESLRKPQAVPLSSNHPQHLEQQHQLNGLGSSGKLNGSTQSLDRDSLPRSRVKMEASPPAPAPAPVKKVGLTLTGAGANFLKSAKSNTSAASSEIATDKTDKQEEPNLAASASNGNGNGIGSSSKSKDIKEAGFKSLYERNKIESLNSGCGKLGPEADAKYLQAQLPDGNNLLSNKLSRKETSSTSVIDPDSESVTGSGAGKPLKSILANSSLKNRVRLDENENPSTTKNLWDISPRDMTDEEYNLWSALDYGAKRETSVKFNLDDPKLTFEFSNPEESDNANETENTVTEEDSEEDDDDDEDVENSEDYDVTNNGERTQSSEVSKPFPQKPSNSGDGHGPTQVAAHPPSDRMQVQNTRMGPPVSTIQNTAPVPVGRERDSAVDRAAIKAAVDMQVKEYEAKIEEEVKQQQRLIRNNMEHTVTLLKSEIESLIEKTKGDFELHKKIEVEKARVEMETTLMKDLGKIKTEYNDKLTRKKQELGVENDKAIQNLNLQHQEQLKDLQNDPKFIQAKRDYDKELEEEILQLKESMNTQHKKQVEEMKSLHQSTIQQLKATFKAEEDKLKKEHSNFIVEMLAKFDTEKHNLLRSFETEQDKIKQEFAAKASQLTAELTQNLEGLKSEVEEKAKKHLATSAAQSDTDDCSKASSPDSHSKTIALKQAEQELVDLRMKYKELEGKYATLKKGVQNVVSEEQAKMKEKSLSLISGGSSKQKDETENKNPIRRSESNQEIPFTEDHDQNNTIDSGAAESDTSFSMSVSSAAARPVRSHNLNSPTPSNPRLQSSDLRINKMMTDSNSRLNMALSALDDLKNQILDIKAEQRKIGKVDLSESEETLQKLQYSEQDNPTTDEIKIIHHRKHSTSHNVTLPMTTNDLRGARSRTGRSDQNTVAGNEPELHLHTNSVTTSKATKDKDSNANPNDDRNYIIEAKDFIKSQKYRLKRSGLTYGTPISTSVGAKHRNEYKHSSNSSQRFNESHAQILQAQYERERKKHEVQIQRLRIDPSQSQDQHHSETESSGVSSLKDHASAASGDKTKIGQDIEGILSSLQQLDGQMKYLWSVVSGTDTSVNANPPNSTPTILSTPVSRPLASTTIPPRSILGPNGPVILTPGPGPGPGYRDPINFSDVAMKYNLSPNLITPGNQALVNSINVANSLQFRRSTDITSKPVPVLTTLEEHVNNIRNRQHRILQQYPAPGTGSNRRSDSPSISERTKDLREWLEKF